MPSSKIGISYGVLAPTIAKQLDTQGFKYNPENVKEFEALREALNILRFGSLLTDSQFDNIVRKLHRKIVSHVAKVNKLTVEKAIR